MPKTKSSATPSVAKPPNTTAAKASAGKKASSSKAAPANIDTTKKGAGAKSADKAPMKVAAPTTITLRHLSTALSERHDMPKKQTDIILTDVFGSLVDHLKAGMRVRIAGLGIIEVKNRPARQGRNPATGAAIQIKASKKVAFRAAKELKEAV